MEKYLNKAWKLLAKFKDYVILKVPQSENSNTDALARLASTYETELPRSVPVEVLNEPSIDQSEMMDIQPTYPA